MSNQPQRNTDISKDIDQEIQEHIHIWDSLATRQDALIQRMIQKNIETSEQLKKYKSELNVYKAGWASLEEENSSLVQKNAKLERNLFALKNDHPLAVCMIDGDGAVFSQELLVQGKEGGREAAFRLSKAILSRIDDVPSEPTVRSPALGDDPAHGVSPHRILAMVYVNASGLATTLVSNGVCSYQQFSEFFFGFNQASPLFTMVDVGPGKEAADAKLRESMQLFARIPQTRRVFFGGAHDSGYIPILTALRTEGLLHKITVLKGSTKVAFDSENFFREVNLRVEEVPGLFLETKLISGLAPVPIFAAPETPDPSTVDEGLLDPLKSPSRKSRRGKQKAGGSQRPPSSLGGSSVAGDVFSNASEAESEPSIPPPKLNPKLPSWRQNPPLCNQYYLGPVPCSAGDRCRFSHDYVLTPAQVEKHRIEMRTLPCTTALANQFCRRGNFCFMGHFCPQGPGCPQLKTGACKFRGSMMHVALPIPVVPQHPQNK